MKTDTRFKETEIGKIPEEWDFDSLKNHLIIKGRIGWKGLKKAEYLTEGYAIINGEQIVDDKIDWAHVGRITKERYDESPEIMLQENDILMTKDGTIGKLAYMDTVREPATVASGIFVIRDSSKRIDSKYLFYIFKSSYFRGLIESRTEGSVVPHLYQRDIVELTIPIPPLPEQRAIAKILSDLDAKIELNRQMNATLEKMAEALFKHWFVDFEFPNEEGKPYKSSGGKMVESELGEIPEGWRVKTISEIAEVKLGRTPPRKESEWFSTSEGVKWVSIKDLGFAEIFIFNTSEKLTEEAVRKFNVPVIKEGTVMLSFKLTVGRVAIAAEDMVSNEAIAHFNLNNQTLLASYLYGYLKQVNYDSLGNTSSIATAINSDNIRTMKILVPSKNLQIKYAQFVEAMFLQIKRNIIEVENLVSTRDTLLPKLMSGKIRVEGASK